MNRKKILVYSVALLFVGVFVLFRIGTYGFTYPACSEREKPLDIPEYLQGAVIKFEHPMVYIRNKENEHCSNTYLASKGSIMSVDKNSPGTVEGFKKYGYEPRLIPEDETFKIIGRTYFSVLPLRHIFFENDLGDIYLLEDRNGDIWMINSIYFKNLDYDSKEKPWNSAYFSETGERLGDVVVESEQICETSFLGDIINCREF